MANVTLRGATVKPCPQLSHKMSLKRLLTQVNQLTHLAKGLGRLFTSIKRLMQFWQEMPFMT